MKKIGTTEQGLLLEMSQDEMAAIWSAASTIASIFRGRPAAPAGNECPSPHAGASGTQRAPAAGPAAPLRQDRTPGQRPAGGGALARRKCDCCGNVYQPRRKDQRFCCKKCGKKAGNAASNMTPGSADRKPVACRVCGREFVPRRKDQQRCGACAGKKPKASDMKSAEMPQPATSPEVDVRAARLARIKALDRLHRTDAALVGEGSGVADA